MSMSIPEILVNDGFISQQNREKIDDFSARSGQSFIKIALNFGYISRKNYERSLLNAGYVIEEIREQEYDVDVLANLYLQCLEGMVVDPIFYERISAPFSQHQYRIIYQNALEFTAIFVKGIRPAEKDI